MQHNRGSRLSVVDFAGTLLHTTAVRTEAETVLYSWAPSARAVVLIEAVLSEDPEFMDFHAWTWDLSTSSALVLINEPAVNWTAWATPSVGGLLVGCEAQQVTLAAGQTQQALQLATAHSWTARTRQGAVAWGSRLAMQTGWQDAANGYGALEIYSLQGSQFMLQDIISAAPGVFVDRQLHVSDDGELLAALKGTPDSSTYSTKLSDACLVLVSLATGSAREFPLQGALANDAAPWGLNLRWSADCTAVLVSVERGEMHQLFRFA